MPFQIPSRNNPAEDRESRQARPETVPAGIVRPGTRAGEPGIDMGESMPEVPAPPAERPGPAESERERENARSGPDADQTERDSRAMRATAAVDRVADATKYGLTIPFLCWLLSYKAGLTAEQFAIASAEDLALADGERVQRAATPAVGSPDETRHAGSGPATDDAMDDPMAGSDPAGDGGPQHGGEDGAAEDVLSIPESRELEGDDAEREAIVGQFGARPSMRDTYYPNLACFVELHVANMWPYQQSVTSRFLWVPDWWRYPPLIYQLDALWRAYENARKQPGQMMIFNIQAFGLFDRVFNKDTGIVASLGIDDRALSTAANTPLPCIRPPKGWRRKAMEPLRPVRPKEMEETMPAMDVERTPHRMPVRRPAMRTADANGNRQEGEL